MNLYVWILDSVVEMIVEKANIVESYNGQEAVEVPNRPRSEGTRHIKGSHPISE